MVSIKRSIKKDRCLNTRDKLNSLDAKGSEWHVDQVFLSNYDELAPSFHGDVGNVYNEDGVFGTLIKSSS
jgi:hypothetical protein